MISASLFFSNSSLVTGDEVEKHLINSNSNALKSLFILELS